MMKMGMMNLLRRLVSCSHDCREGKESDRGSRLLINISSTLISVVVSD